MRAPRRHPSRRNARMPLPRRSPCLRRQDANPQPPPTSAPPPRRRSPRLALQDAISQPPPPPPRRRGYRGGPAGSDDRRNPRPHPSGGPGEPCKRLFGQHALAPAHMQPGVPTILRSYRELHPVPPLLGFLGNTGKRTSFLPTSTFHLKPSFIPPEYKALDARHGRVLFHDPFLLHNRTRTSLVIWDPITKKKRKLRMPMDEPMVHHWSVVLLCTGDRCNELRCHDHASLVLFVGTDDMMVTFAILGSTEINQWDRARQIEHPHAIVDTGPSVVLGKKLYFPCTINTRIIEYDYGAGKFQVVDTPVVALDGIQTTIVMTARNGLLGFACIAGSKLHMWSREDTGNGGSLAWVPGRVLDLPMMYGIPRLVGSDDGVIVVKTGAGVYTMNLKSGSDVKMISTKRKIIKVIPYSAFCTPSWRNINHSTAKRTGGSIHLHGPDASSVL